MNLKERIEKIRGLSKQKKIDVNSKDFTKTAAFVNGAVSQAKDDIETIEELLKENEKLKAKLESLEKTYFITNKSWKKMAEKLEVAKQIINFSDEKNSKEWTAYRKLKEKFEE